MYFCLNGADIIEKFGFDLHNRAICGGWGHAGGPTAVITVVSFGSQSCRGAVIT